MNYVLGFCIDVKRENVLVIRKNRPAWQAGRFNAIGGKINDGEYSIDAIVREFHEETSVKTSPDNWDLFHIMSLEETEVSKSVVFCFRMFSDRALSEAKSVTDEQIDIVPIDSLRQLSTINNLKWLVPLACDNSSSSPKLTVSIYGNN